MADVRVTRVAFGGLISVPAPARTTKVQAQTHYADRTFNVRVTKVQAQAQYNDRTHPVRTTLFQAQALISLSEISIQRPLLKDRELNPFRATVPVEVQDLGHEDIAVQKMAATVQRDFLEEQAKEIRNQHNLTQAGDSTAPWEFLTRIGPERQHTLGALGRFYHDDFGIVQARYVQFTKMVEGPWLNGPCGRLNTSTSIDWKVTNDLRLSSALNVEGIIASYQLPAEGEYGWIIVDGANITPLLLNPLDPAAVQDQLTWTSFETVGTQAKGRVLGRVLAPAVSINQNRQLAPGTAYIKIEGLSPKSVATQFSEDFTAILVSLEDIKTRLAAVEALDVAQLEKDIKKLRTQYTGLNQRLAYVETSNASFAERLHTLEEFMDGIGALLDQLHTTITNEQSLVTNALGLRIDALSQALTDLTLLINGWNIPNLIELVTEIGNRADEALRNAHIKLIPLVSGSVPPDLVYLPDGRLVFVEEIYP